MPTTTGLSTMFRITIRGADGLHRRVERGAESWEQAAWSFLASSAWKPGDRITDVKEAKP